MMAPDVAWAWQAMVDACKVAGVDFVVYTSVADCEKATPGMTHFHTKLAVEGHLKASGLRWAILRPVAFLENFDNQEFRNPLTKGFVKGLTFDPDLKVKHVSTVDVGKAAARMLGDPAAWAGKTLDCASCDISGADAAAALSEVSGVPCQYRNMFPPYIGYWILRLFLPDLWHMVEFFRDVGYSSDVAAFREVVPDALDARAWFRHKGRWASSEPFPATQ